jgi:hypothetical protein
MLSHAITFVHLSYQHYSHLSTLPHATTYALHCVNIHSNVPVLINTGPASGNPHLVVPKTIHSDVKCANAVKYAHMAN